MILDVHEDESDSLQEHKQQCGHVKLFQLFSQNKHIWHFLLLITSVTMATAVLWVAYTFTNPETWNNLNINKCVMFFFVCFLFLNGTIPQETDV